MSNLADYHKLDHENHLSFGWQTNWKIEVEKKTNNANFTSKSIIKHNYHPIKINSVRYPSAIVHQL